MTAATQREKIMKTAIKHPLDDAKIGDGATYRIYTDCQAGTIIARTRSKITWQQDKATLLNGVGSGEQDALTFVAGGFCGHTSGNQRYAYERNLDGETKQFSRRVLDDGQIIWKAVGSRTRESGHCLSAGRHEFYDFNF